MVIRMRKYIDKEQTELLEVTCNQCGRQLQVENGIIKEGCFHTKFAFGYFGHKDGELHSFDLCEACYNQMVDEFKIPITIEETTEFV